MKIVCKTVILWVLCTVVFCAPALTAQPVGASTLIEHEASASSSSALLDQAITIAEGLEAPVQKARLWLEVARGYKKIGDLDKGATLLKRAHGCLSEHRLRPDYMRLSENVRQEQELLDIEVVRMQSAMEAEEDKEGNLPGNMSLLKQKYADVVLSRGVQDLLKTGRATQAIAKALAENKTRERGRVLLAVTCNQVSGKNYVGARKTYRLARATRGGDTDLELLILAGTGNYKECARIYRGFEANARSSEMFHTFEEVQTIFAETGNIPALQALLPFAETGGEFEVYARLALAYFDKGDVKKALKIARDDLGYLNFGLSQQTLREIAVRQARRGNYPAAIALTSSIQQPDPFMRNLHRVMGGDTWLAYRDLALQDIAAIQANRGRVGDALQTVGSIREEAARGEALGETVTRQVQKGSTDTAMKSLASVALNNVEVRRLALMVLARFLTQAKSADTALTLAALEPPYIKGSMLVAVAIQTIRPALKHK